MPRTNLMERRAYDAGDLDAAVTCPAGERIGERIEGPACRCRIEDSIITAARDGSSLALLCQGDHEMCPSWRAAREQEWAHRPVADLIGRDGLERSFDMGDLREMSERAASGDVEGARARLAEIKERHLAQAKERALP